LKKHLKKIIILALVAAGVVAFFALDLGQYFTLEYIKGQQARFDSYYAEHRATVIGTYLAVYVAVTALSLPGAAVMTLLGGAIFGLLTGTIIVSFASTIGATLACFVSRFVLRDWVQGSFGDKLQTVNAGIEREGSFYLFTLRLIPVFPFFIINLVMGLTRMPLRTFYWVSQVGMLPGTIVYVNAGKELGQLESLSGILSPGLIGAFVLLGVFPIAVKKIMGYYRKKKGVAPVEEIAQTGSETSDAGDNNG